MTFSTYNLTTEQLSRLNNQAKDIFIGAMLRENVLTEEQVKTMNKYCIVVHEKGFLGKFWEKLWANSEERARVSVVKIIE